MEEIKENSTNDKIIITIGDPSNAFIDEDDDCILFNINKDLNDYNIDKYNKNIKNYSCYTNK